jgi:hypothetical protein
MAGHLYIMNAENRMKLIVRFLRPIEVAFPYSPMLFEIIHTLYMLITQTTRM